MRIGIAADNTVPLNLPSLCNFINAHASEMNCVALEERFRFSQTQLVFSRDTAHFGPRLREALAQNELNLLITAIPYANNYFYEGDGNVTLLSLANWHLLTSLPMSNGILFFLCQLIVTYELSIGQSHDENTGCINDFLWDKTGIDVSMRAAFICERCREISADSENISSQLFKDAEAILNVVSSASRRGVDVLSEALPNKAGPGDSVEEFDVFLSHNSRDKPVVRKLNEALKSRKVRTWLDEDQVELGEPWQRALEKAISRISACAIIVGDNGIGPWMDMEVQAFIREFVNRGARIIPVLVGSSEAPPGLPPLLAQFPWLDLRDWDERKLDRLAQAVSRHNRS